MPDNEVTEFYEREYNEESRLETGSGLLELLRTQAIISDFLPEHPVRIADIGGGPGVYSQWLAGLGHDVTLIDPARNHVKSALERPISGGRLQAHVGDARGLEVDDQSVDVVLLLGPLYHLRDTKDRQRSLSEAFRILRPGGHLLAAAISRFASLHDGIASGWLQSPSFQAIAENDLRTGRHENPERLAGWFTTAYFHRPDELRSEVEDAGFGNVQLISVEGVAGWLPDLDERLADADQRAMILDVSGVLQFEPSLHGASAHILAHATRSQDDAPRSTATTGDNSSDIPTSR